MGTTVGGIAQVALPRGLFSFGEWLVQHEGPYLWVGNRFRCSVEVNTLTTGTFVVDLPDGCWTNYPEAEPVRTGRCALDGRQACQGVTPRLPTGCFRVNYVDLNSSVEYLTVDFLVPGRRLLFRASSPVLQFEPGAPVRGSVPAWLDIARALSFQDPELARPTSKKEPESPAESLAEAPATPELQTDDLFTTVERKVLRLFAGTTMVSLSNLCGQFGRRASGMMAELMEKMAQAGHPVIQIIGHDDEGPTYGRLGPIPAAWSEERTAR